MVAEVTDEIQASVACSTGLFQVALHWTAHHLERKMSHAIWLKVKFVFTVDLFSIIKYTFNTVSSIFITIL